MAAPAGAAAEGPAGPTGPAGSTGPNEPTEPLGADALWVWSWDDPAELSGFVADSGFDRVYLYAQGGFDRRVRRATTALTARGIAVEALGVEKRWATTQRRDMLRFVRSARRYQRSAPPGERLAGIHVDVEPYDLRAWDRDQGRVSRSLVAALRSARRRAGSLPFAADIPFWFDGIRAGSRSLAERAIAATDAVTIMAYRDSAGAVADVAKREVAIAGRLGKSATIGVETADVSPPQVTFFQEGRDALIAALAEVSTTFAGQPGFGGTAVHHYGSLVDLR